MKTFITLLFFVLSFNAFAQSFTKITNPANPIVTDLPTMGYAGASWVDYDSDGDIDLFVNQDFLYQNDGNGNFTRVLDSGIQGVSIEYNNGNSWADFDNDGDVDLMLVNRNQNGLYSNNGDGTFTKITMGDIATNVNAWSPAWADYDNDGWLDLVATHACGGTGMPCHSNWLFHNNGDGTFTEVTNSDITAGFATYTSANWSDFDNDGDMDLFIGSGAISQASKDHIYINQLMETGTADLERRETGALFGDFRDGQNWNWIDYDNDGDLDGFVTNYKEDIPCDFYKNNGDGTFTRLLESDLGTHMASETGTWLANVWGDFDNDGWLDVVIGYDGFAGTGVSHLYHNNGDGTFSHAFTPFTNNSRRRGMTAGDYDNDGDLDLFINSSTFNSKGLYRNNQSGANWVNFSLQGTFSNRSAIGAKVRLKANINGQAIWQMREISAQNSFAGHNSQRVHFGLDDAANIDSVVIEWPLGLVEIYTNVAVNQFYVYEEGTATGIFEAVSEAIPLNVFPNPFSESVRIDLQDLQGKAKYLEIYDARGTKVYAEVVSEAVPWLNLSISYLSPGFYLAKIQTENEIAVAKMVKEK